MSSRPTGADLLHKDHWRGRRTHHASEILNLALTLIRLDRQNDAAAVGSLLVKLMKDAGDTAAELLIELLTRESSAAISYHQVVQVFKTLIAYSSGETYYYRKTLYSDALETIEPLVTEGATRDEHLFHAYAGFYAFKMWENEESSSVRRPRLLLRATASLQRALELAPSEEIYAIELSRYLHITGSTPQAIAVLEDFHRTWPDFPNSTRHLALLLTESERVPQERILALWREVLKHDPLCERAMSVLLTAFYGGNQYVSVVDVVLALIERTIYPGPHLCSTWEALAQVLKHINEAQRLQLRSVWVERRWWFDRCLQPLSTGDFDTEMWKYICAELMLGSESEHTLAISSALVKRREWGPHAVRTIMEALPDE